MTGLQRTMDFLDGRPVDRSPCHPIIMRWAARYGSVKYRDFCLNYQKKCAAMIRTGADIVDVRPSRPIHEGIRTTAGTTPSL